MKIGPAPVPAAAWQDSPAKLRARQGLFTAASLRPGDTFRGSLPTRSRDELGAVHSDPATEMIVVKLASPPVAADAHIYGVSLSAYQAIADPLVQRE